MYTKFTYNYYNYRKWIKEYNKTIEWYNRQIIKGVKEMDLNLNVGQGKLLKVWSGSGQESDLEQVEAGFESGW